MESISSVNAGTAATSAAVDMSAGATGSLGQAMASSQTTAAAVTSTTSSMTFSVQSSDASLTLSDDHSSKMVALVMALIDILLGLDDDEDQKKAGLIALLAAAGAMAAQSSSQVQYSQSSFSMSASLIQQTTIGAGYTSNGTPTATPIDAAPTANLNITA